jgi:hypothetical protein
MASRKDLHGMRIGGMIVTGIGIFFLLEELDLIPNVGRMWPVIPIIVGVSLLVTSFSRPTSENDDSQ